MSSSPGVEISKRLVFVNTLSSVVTRLLSLTVLVWLTQYLIGEVPTEEYALYPIVIAIILFTQIFTGVLTGGIARYATEAYAKGDTDRVTAIVSSMMPLMAKGTVAFLTIGALGCWQVDSILTIAEPYVFETQVMLGLMLLHQGIRLFVTPFLVGLHMRQKFIWLNLIQLGQEVCRIALVLSLLFGVSTKVLWVVVATAVSSMLATLVTFIVSRKLVPQLRYDRAARHPELIRELTSFGSWTMIGQLAWRIRMSSDVLVLNKLGTENDIASFHIGTMVDRQVDAFMALASTTLNPPLTAMHATQQQDALRSAFLRGNRIALWLALAAAAPVVVYAEDLVVLYVGDEFISAAAVAVAIYGSYALTYSAEMLHGIAIATARVRGFMLMTIIGAIAKLALSIVLVGVFELGAFGAALSTPIVLFLVHVLVAWPMGVRMLNITFGRYLRESILPGCLPAIAAALAFVGLGALMPPTTWTSVAIDTGLGLIVYAIVVLFCFRAADWRDFRGLLQRLRSRFG